MSWSIVVTDGEQRSALAVVRSLGRAGHSVHVCASTAHSLAGASRFSDGATIVPDALTNPDGFVAALAQVVTARQAKILLPISEAALLAVLPDRHKFRCIIPFSDAEWFERICDKGDVLRAASVLGIDVPVQRVLISRGDLTSLRDMPFPIVLKPSRSVAGSRGSRVKTGVLYAADVHGLTTALRSLPDAAFPVLCQQRIEGLGTAVSLMVWDGEVKAAFAHRRLREKPPSGGVSVLRESIPLDAALLAKSVSLLHEFRWQGVAMVEYKVATTTGRPYLMEINGRFWGSLQLAIDAGIDFPLLLAQSAMGMAVAPRLSYPSGVRTRWEWGEVDHLLARLRHSPSDLSLPADAPTRVQAAKAFLEGFSTDVRCEVFSLDDIRPFVRESLNWVRGR